MSTLKQISANRLNAQKSTGPRSVAGKAASSMNALKTGIHAQSLVIRGESAEDLQTLTAEYYDHWCPTSPEERLWLDTLIRNEWLLRRLALAEAQLWEYGLAKAWNLSQTAPLGQAYASREDSFRHLQRRINDTQRNCARALEQLQRLQKLRREADDAPDPEPLLAARPLGSGLFEPATPLESTVPVEIGFVPQPDPRPLESLMPHSLRKGERLPGPCCAFVSGHGFSRAARSERKSGL